MRRYDLPVLVRTARPDGSCAGGAQQQEPLPPAQFLWQGRLYVVREVLAQWRERTAWWSGAAGRGVHGDTGPEPVEGPGHVGAGRGPRQGRSAVQERWDAADRWVWRVQASAGRSGATGTYDLSRQGPPEPAHATDGSAGADGGTWRLVRVCD